MAEIAPQHAFMPKKPASAVRRAFAERLAAARLTAGYETEKDFAQHALGIDAQRYRRWERAETEPDLAMLVKIATATVRSLDWLVRGIGDAAARSSSNVAHRYRTMNEVAHNKATKRQS